MSITFKGKQAKLYDIDAHDFQIVIACGEAQSGKSKAMCFGFLSNCMQNYNNARFVLACFGDPAWRGVIRPYVDEWAETTNSTVAMNAKGVTITSIDPNTHRTITNEFIRITGNSASALTRLQGPTISGIYATEAAEMPEDLIDEFLVRMVAADGSPRLLLDANPAGTEHHWFKTKWIDRIVRTRARQVGAGRSTAERHVLGVPMGRQPGHDT